MSEQYILTSTGRKFWPLDPRPEDVCLQDIAHALSMKCRFTGHCGQFFSVGAHSLFVTDMLRRDLVSVGADEDLNRILMYALLHDAAEAYLPDIAAPIKSDISGFAEIEHRVMRAIYEGLGLEWPNLSMFGYVKAADTEALRHEMRALLPLHPDCNDMVDVYDGMMHPGMEVAMSMCAGPDPFYSIEKLFVHTFMQLNQNEGVRREYAASEATV